MAIITSGNQAFPLFRESFQKIMSTYHKFPVPTKISASIIFFNMYRVIVGFNFPQQAFFDTRAPSTKYQTVSHKSTYNQKQNL